MLHVLMEEAKQLHLQSHCRRATTRLNWLCGIKKREARAQPIGFEHAYRGPYVMKIKHRAQGSKTQKEESVSAQLQAQMLFSTVASSVVGCFITRSSRVRGIPDPSFFTTSTKVRPISTMTCFCCVVVVGVLNLIWVLLQNGYRWLWSNLRSALTRLTAGKCFTLLIYPMPWSTCVLLFLVFIFILHYIKT